MKPTVFPSKYSYTGKKRYCLSVDSKSFPQYSLAFTNNDGCNFCISTELSDKSFKKQWGIRTLHSTKMVVSRNILWKSLPEIMGEIQTIKELETTNNITLPFEIIEEKKIISITKHKNLIELCKLDHRFKLRERIANNIIIGMGRTVDGMFLVDGIFSKLAGKNLNNSVLLISNDYELDSMKIKLNDSFIKYKFLGGQKGGYFCVLKKEYGVIAKITYPEMALIPIDDIYFNET